MRDRLFEATKYNGSLKGQEERDACFGRLFGCAAIARSGRLGNSDANADVAVQLLQAVVELHRMRHWLRQVTVEAALDIAKELPDALLLSKGVPLLQQMLRPATTVSDGIIRLLLNHAGKEGATLHAMARSLLAGVSAATTDSADVQVALAASLLQKGGPRFDARTGTRTVSELLEYLDAASVFKHVEFLKAVARGGEAVEAPEADEPGANNTEAQNLTWAVDALYALTRSPRLSTSLSSSEHGALFKNVALFFLECGMFAQTEEDGASVAVTQEVRDACEKRFFSMLSDTATKPMLWRAATPPGSSESESESEGVLETLYGLHLAWSDLHKGRALLHELKEEDAAARKAMLKAVKGIRSAHGQAADKLSSAFAVLMMHVGFLPLSPEADVETHDFLNDLLETYKRMSAATAADTAAAAAAASDDPMAVLADLLIAMMAIPGLHAVRGMREVAKRAWGAVCACQSMTPAALECIIAAVCGDDKTDEDDAGEDGEDDDSDDDGDSDTDGEDDSAGESKGEGDNTKQKRKRGLKTPPGDGRPAKRTIPPPQPVESDGGSSDSDGGAADDSDEEMIGGSDIEGLLGSDGEDGIQHHEGADAALAAMLNLKRGSRKAGALAALRTEAQLRLRALDLLDVYCARQKDSPLLPTALVPVFKALRQLYAGDAARASEGRALRERIQALFKNQLCRAKPKPEAVAAAAPDFSVAEAFAFFLQACRKAPGKALLALATEGLLSVTRLTQRSPAEAAAASQELASTLARYLDKDRSIRVDGRFFSMLLQRYPGLAPALLPPLVSGVAGAKNDFLKSEASRLLAEILNKIKAMDDAAKSAVLSQSAAILTQLTAVVGGTAAAAATEAEPAPAAEASKGASKLQKTKHLKPVLQCCSLLLKADGGAALAGYEFEALLSALDAAAESATSTSISAICDGLKSRIADVQQLAPPKKPAAAAAAAATPKKKRKGSDAEVAEAGLVAASGAGDKQALAKAKTSTKKAKKAKHSGAQSAKK
eukprot:TRINITY_DN802_c0_g1_i1.p1 TRINITY_DN802_c0_g1~~TRINITY_DN802_c0_g1_i1.p1  ORF type:complete len:1151 (-),score=461.40 TRINITY_DN802_c0_g1_i1:77-3088(-)